MRILKIYTTVMLVTFMLTTFVFGQNKTISINVKDRGARGNGVDDDWEIIQRSIDEVINKGGGTVFLPKGIYAIYGKSIAIWGSNVQLKGEGATNTSIVKKGEVGYFGECIDICGKINGYQYYGEFGQGDYNIIRFYRGKTIKSNNIKISGLKISTDLNKNVKKRIVANNLGIINSTNVSVMNCIIENAPQSNVAIVNDTELFDNGKIYFYGCTFKNSQQHNVRVISYNRGNFMGNFVTFDSCNFFNVKGGNPNMKELGNKNVLLWYRGTIESNKSSLMVKDCRFDNSGMIFANSNVNGLQLLNNEIRGGVNIQHATNFEKEPEIIIRNNTISLSENQGNYSNDLQKLNRSKKLKNGYQITKFGTVYPNVILKSKKFDFN